MEKVAYNSGRRAFIKGWTVCIFKRPDDRAAWYRGFQDEQDELETLAKGY